MSWVDSAKPCPTCQSERTRNTFVPDERHGMAFLPVRLRSIIRYLAASWEQSSCRKTPGSDRLSGIGRSFKSARRGELHGSRAGCAESKKRLIGAVNEKTSLLPSYPQTRSTQQSMYDCAVEIAAAKECRVANATGKFPFIKKANVSVVPYWGSRRRARKDG